MTLDILNVVQLRSKGILNVNDDDLPIGLSFVKESHDTENLDLFNLTRVTDLFANFAYIERIVVTLCLGFLVRVVWIFPSLEGVHLLERKT